MNNWKNDRKQAFNVPVYSETHSVNISQKLEATSIFVSMLNYQVCHLHKDWVPYDMIWYILVKCHDGMKNRLYESIATHFDQALIAYRSSFERRLEEE